MTWIQTYTGRQVYPLAMGVEQIDVRDICHSLAMLCRFNGHCTSFYSVAQHSVHVAEAVEPKYQRIALLHDAAEAYIGDITRPLKPHTILHPWGMPFKVAEDAILDVIYDKFCISPDDVRDSHDQIKHADDMMLATEARDIMATHPEPWETLPEPSPFLIEPWSPETAEVRWWAFAKRLGLVSGDLIRDNTGR